MGANTKKCVVCRDEKRITDFYMSYHPLHDKSRIPACKKCLRDMVNIEDMDSVKKMLRMVDKPFITHLWSSAKKKKVVLGEYFKLINAKDFRSFTWEDSDGQNEEVEIIDEKVEIHQKSKFKITDELIYKWGEGYTPEEYRSFERKYQMLKNNYQEKTAMHTEALLTYIRYRVKEELATAKGEVKEAKEWGALAQKAAQDAKINPSQLSKSDLSDGLDTFGQLVRTVEQAVDIIPILPQFKERPQDKVDFTIWTYINYIRDLKGLPLAEYNDIYRFYEERKKEYAGRFDFLQDGDE